jgi:hypothetical protein
VTGTAPAGNATATPQAACAATDGDLLATGHLTAAGAKVVTGVTVDLGRARRVNLVVVRGFAGEFLVEASTDGRTFAQVGISSGSPAAVHPSGTPTARYVRVRSPSGLDESLLAELSVW